MHAETPDAEAQTLFRRGVAALQKNSFALAADSFQRSYDLVPKAAAICNLAITFDRWAGHEADALTAYRRCAEDDNSGRFRDHALARSRALRAVVPQPDPEPEPVPEPPRPTPPRPVAPPPEPAPQPVVTPPPRPIVLPPPNLVAAPLPAKRRSHRLLIGGAVVTVVGLALLGGGIGTNVKANQGVAALNPFVMEEPDGMLSIPGDKKGLLRDIQNNQAASKALYGVGGAIAGVGVVLMIVDAAIEF